MRYDVASMASCPSCGADGGIAGGSCPRCGADISPRATSATSPAAGASASSPSLELDIPARKPQKAPAKKQAEAELHLELAIDPRSLVQPASSEPSPASGPRARPDAGPSAATPSKRGGAAGLVVRGGSGGIEVRRVASDALAVGDVAFDARLLADYGEAPGHWLLSGAYAWRVLRRQREIKQALEGRREEAARAATALEDALVAFAERAKGRVSMRPPPLEEEKGDPYAALLAEARSAEETLRSRDAVLAADQDAHQARLAAVSTRLDALETELVAAQSSERAIATEIASSQGALGRAEAKLKRAESEVRAAARDGIGTDP
jgi:hypothetical protein